MNPVNFCISFEGIPASAFGTVGTVGTSKSTVFTRPILSGYLTKINETRIVKLR